MNATIQLRGAETPAPDGVAWKGVPPETGTLYIVRDFRASTNRLFLDHEEMGALSDAQIMRLYPAPVVVDWDAWRAAKLTTS